MRKDHSDSVKAALARMSGPEEVRELILRLIDAWDDDYYKALVTEEEGSEIYAEQTAAMAVLFGEAIRPCSSPCQGHLGEKAMDALTSAGRTWISLQELVVRQAQRIQELEVSVAVLPMTTFDVGE